MSETASVISDEKQATAPTIRALKWLVAALAVTMSLYHMYVAGFGPPEAVIFRGTHLMFAMALVFLLYPTRPGGGLGWRLLDFVLLGFSLAFVLHVFITYEAFTNRIIYIDDLTAADKFFAVVAVLMVLEGTRRVIGLALPLTALAFLAYAGLFTHVTLPVLMEQVYLSTEGIFGSTLGVSASYVMLFVIFGAFMEKSGTGQLFMDFAMSITGHTAGGPGKVAVISSSLFGTVSGSAVANVMVDGPITIPLMKRTGFRPPFAAAVEAVASTGGQIMPPVMGAAAFVMAEFLSVPYAQVAVWAVVPALLYYVAVFFAVHFEAKRYKLAGVPKDELPRFTRVMAERGHLFTPILIILAGLFMGYSAPLCALVGALSCLPVALLRKSTRVGHHLEKRGRGAGRGREERAVGGDGLRLRRHRHCLRDGHGPGHRVHPDRDRAGAEPPDPRAHAHRSRRHHPWHGHADHAGLYRDGRAAGAGGDQDGRGHPGSPHVRLLLRHPLGDHAARGPRRVRGREPGQGRHLDDRLRGDARGRPGLHRALHVRVRADAAADRQGLGHGVAVRRLVGDLRHHRRDLPRRQPVRLAARVMPRCGSAHCCSSPLCA